MAVCSICSNAPARALIDGALLAGYKPIEAHRYHGAALHVSLSAVYRHARAHRPEGTALALPFIDAESTVGELLSDLGGLRRSLLAQYEAQRQAGNEAASTRSAHEAHAVSATLLKTGVDDDAVATALVYAESMIRGIQRATRNRPAFALELAAAAREFNDFELAADAERISASATDYLASTA